MFGLVTRWFTKLLERFGLRNKRGSILLLGLDNAGKTTLLNTLKNDHKIQTVPTTHSTNEEFVLGNITFTATDVGGHVPARRIWPQYFVSCDAIVFLVDVSDVDRLEETRQEYQRLMESAELKSKPILILGNKADLIDCSSSTGNHNPVCTEFYLQNYLNHGILNGDAKTSKIYTVMCSIKDGYGYEEGLRWLGSFL
jgi:GTP-binding protein SAR1